MRVCTRFISPGGKGDKVEEPSVLDYVKEKLAFWKRSTLSLPAGPEVEVDDQPLLPEQPVVEAPEVLTRSAEEVPLTPHPRTEWKGRFPWMAVAPLALGLAAQWMLEPPDRFVPAAVILYIVCAGLVVFAFLRRELQPVSLPESQPRSDSLVVNWEGLVISVLLMLATYIFSGAERGQPHDFNLVNTPLWLLSIGYMVWALRTPGTFDPRSWLGRWFKTLARPTWGVSFSRWTVLLLAVAGIVLFFRLYRLDGLPSDMVSDHAEKLLDVQDVLNGETHFFFPRNTGREFFQFYWTVLMIKLFDLPVSFLALKVGTAVAGLITLVYIYRLGFELGNRWVALLALAFCGVSYWGNIMARIGLRFPLYPLFTAPLLFYLLRGLRTMDRSDFIKAGLVLGLGLHGYTSYRIVPLLVVVGFAIYIIHESSLAMRKRAAFGLAIVTLVSLAVFMPLLRFAFDDPQLFMYRSITRLGEAERSLPGPAGVIFVQNLWNAVTMFFYNDGDVWVHSVPNRPALDIVSASLFFIGGVLVAARYVRRRHWLDLFLLVSIPVLLLPSVLSLAFPNENPNLNRTAGAYVPVFLILALGLDGLLRTVKANLPGRLGISCAWVIGLILFYWASVQNYDLLFNQYDQGFRAGAWNSTEMGADVRRFEELTGSENNAFVVAYPYWVDTRAVGIEAGHTYSDLAISPDRLQDTLGSPGAKLFILNREDLSALASLQSLYPEGRYWLRKSRTPNKEYYLFLVPPVVNLGGFDPGQITP